MIIDLAKKYRTDFGAAVKLYDILDGYVHGVYFNSTGPDGTGLWMPSKWKVDNGYFVYPQSGETSWSSIFNLTEIDDTKFEFAAFNTWYFEVKDVEYCDFQLTVPKSIKFIATDETGNIYGYVERPEIGLRHWCVSEKGSGYSIKLASIRYTGNWENSLMEVR